MIGFQLALAAAGVLLLVGSATGARRSAAWLACALAGQATNLQLIRAGHLIGYQHYRLELVSALDRLLYAGLAVQAIVVGLGLWRARKELLGWTGRVGRVRVALVLAVIFAISAFPSRDPGIFLLELGVAGVAQLVQLAAMYLTVRALPSAGRARLVAAINRLFGSKAAERPGHGHVYLDRFVVGAAVWAAVVSATLAYASYQAHPHVPDEVAYLFQARSFAAGRLSVPAPAAPEAFEVYLIQCEPDRCFSVFPPGWPLVLAAGVAVGVPFLVNPVLTGLTVVLVYLVTGQLYGDRRLARLVTALAACSPWVLLMGMSLLSHPLALCASLTALYCVVELRRGGPWVWALGAGAAVSLLLATRPLEGVAGLGLIGLLTISPGAWRSSWARLAAVAAAAVPGVILTLGYNLAITGRATSFAVSRYMDAVFGAGTTALGFGANRDTGWRGLDPLPGHGLIDVIVNTDLNTVALNVELLGWGTASLIPCLLLLLKLEGKPVGGNRHDGWMLTIIAAVVGAYSLYYFSGGPDFGARYWYLTAFPLLVLSARGLERAARTLPLDRADARAMVTVFALGCSLLAVLTFLPWRAVDKYYRYREMQPGVRQVLARRDFGRSLLLVRGRPFPDYASAAVYNPLEVAADAPLLAWEGGPDVTAHLLATERDRPVWILDGPSRTGGEFQVVAGPLDADGAIDWLADDEPGGRVDPGEAVRPNAARPRGSVVPGDLR